MTNNIHHLQFPVNQAGEVSSFALNSAPYLEGGIGLYNIFKLVRIDLIKRFTWLDNPDAPSLLGQKGLGLRVSLKLDF